jgi:hypothetical protein
MLPARCTAEHNGLLRNSRRMGLRKRFRPRAASSNRSGDSSGGKGFAQRRPLRWAEQQRQIQPRLQQKRSSSAQGDTGRHVSKGVRQTLLKITTGLVASRPLRRRLRWRRCRFFFPLCHTKSLNGRSGMSRIICMRSKESSLKSRPTGGFDQTRADNAVILQSQFSHLPDSYTDPCILIWHVINANTLAQHVRFVELPSGFDSGPCRVVVFFYNWTVVMEKSS